jgi:hypothetical protein
MRPGLGQIRDAANEKITAALEKFDADYANLPADAPLSPTDPGDSFFVSGTGASPSSRMRGQRR